MIASMTGWKLLMPEGDGAEHDLLGQLLGLGFDHQHALAGAGDDQIELRARQLVERRVQHVFAVDVADPAAADRAHERDAGNRQGRRGADHRDDVGVVLQIVAQHGADDLRLVAGNPDTKSGRIGRSISRETSVSFSEGRPSRLKKPPGILPAANVFSW